MPQAVIAAGAAAASASAVAAFGFAAGSIGAALVTAGVSYAFAKLGERFVPDPQLGEQTLPGTQLSFRDPQAPRETVYGTVRKGGPIVFMAPSGADNEWLHVVIVLAAHECTAIGDAYFNGVSEHELLHFNTYETVNVVWQRTFSDGQGGGSTGSYPPTFSVELEGVTFSDASVQGLADQINASAEISDITATRTTTRRPGSSVNRPNDAVLQLVADTNDRDKMRVQAQESIASCRIFIDYPIDDEQDAFRIWRHLGGENQAADAELIRLFSAGRRARIVVLWDSDRDTLNITVNDRQITGSIADIIDYVESDTLGATIEVRQQGPAELVFEHRSPGVAIDVSSTNNDFSREIAETAVPAWTSAHQGRGLCYAHVRLARRSDVWGNQAPNITFDVEGKALYDPRSGSDAFSDNWALVIRDYLEQTCKVPDARLNDAEFAIAATICDEAVTLDSDGKTQARYTLNGIVQESEQPGDVLVKMQEHGGRILRRRGMWTVSPWIDQPPLTTLAEDDYLSVPQITLGHSYQDSFNTVVATYAAEDTSWQSSPAPPVTSSLYVNEDGQERRRSIDLRFVDGSYRAQRLARIALEEHRQGITVELTVPLHRIDCEEGRIVPLDHARWGWSGKLFRIDRVVANVAAEPSDNDISGGIALTLREYAPGAYDWNLGMATLVDLAPNTTLSPARYVEAPVGLVVSTVPAWHTTDSNAIESARVLASWRDPVQSDISHYELAWRSADVPTWTPAPNTRTTNVVIGPVPDNSAVDVRVRAVGMQGRPSRWATVADVPVNSVAALVGVDGEANVTLAQTAPTEPGQGDIWLQTNASDEIIARWYWDGSTWADVSGNRIAAAIASAYTVEALVEGFARVFIKPSTDVPLATGLGDLWLQTDTSKVMTWDGAAWVVASSLQWDDILGPGKAEDNAANTGASPIPDPHFEKEKATPGQFWQYGDGSAVQLIDAAQVGKAALVLADQRLLTKHRFALHTTGYYEFRLRLSRISGAFADAPPQPECFVRFYYADGSNLDVSLKTANQKLNDVGYKSVVYRGFSTGVTGTRVPVASSFGIWNKSIGLSGQLTPDRVAVDSFSVIEPTSREHLRSNIMTYRDENGELSQQNGTPVTVIPNLSHGAAVYGTGVSGTGNFGVTADLELDSHVDIVNANEQLDATVEVSRVVGTVATIVFQQVVATQFITAAKQVVSVRREFAIPNFEEIRADDTGEIDEYYYISWSFSLPNVDDSQILLNGTSDVMATRFTMKITEPITS